MKTLKSLAIIAGMAFIGLNVSAQAIDPQQFGKTETARIKANVTGITSDEESQIVSAEQEYGKGMEGVRTYTGSDDRDMMRKNLADNRDTKLKAILTADQYTQYQAMQKASK